MKFKFKRSDGEKIESAQIDPGQLGYVAPDARHHLWGNPEMQEDNEEAAWGVTFVAEARPIARSKRRDVRYSVDMPRSSYPAGLGPGSRIQDMHAKAKAWHLPFYGTKSQLWERLI